MPISKNPVNWLLLRKQHAEGVSISALAKIHGVSRDTIHNHKKKEQWGDTLREMTASAVQGAIDKVALEAGESIAADLLAHADLVSGILDYANAIVKKGASGLIKPGDKQNEADVLNSVVTAVKNAIFVSREINGIRPGTPSTGSKEDDGARIFEFVLPEAEENIA